MAVAWSFGSKIETEAGRSLDLGGERSLFGEEQIFEKRFADTLEVIHMAVSLKRHGALIMKPSEEIVHVRLVFEHHEGNNVAVGRGITRYIEEAREIFYIAKMIGRALLLGKGVLSDKVAAM